MNNAIIGLGYGDEGKGLITDYLCSYAVNPLVIRYSGGQQAGHTVVFDNKRHVFSNFGSGSLRGVSSYWSKYCTVDPIGIYNELNSLLKKEVSPCLYIDRECPVTTPYDSFHNQQTDNINGTCGVGVGSTKQREENNYSLLFGDLFYPWILKTKLNLIRKYYNFDKKISLDKFMLCVDAITTSDYIKESDDSIIHRDQSDNIFEGSQGLMLDQNIGFFPHVTRSNTGTKNILSFDPWCYLVTRAYQTRHGSGPMSNEDIPHNIKINPHETNITNKYQGVFRRALLDADMLLYAINSDEYIRRTQRKSLVITCLDHIKDEYRFTHKGNIVYCNGEIDFVERISEILKITSVYVSMSDESKNLTQTT
jgi:adenylosuccinate synthase